MRQIIIILTIVLFSSCSYEDKQSDIKLDNKSIESKTIGIEVPNKLIGAYISKEYLDELQKHGSAKIAQESARMSTAYIEKMQGKVIFSNTWNFHEGGGTDEIEMVSDEKANVLDEASNEIIYTIDIVGKDQITITIDGEVYDLEKYSDNPKDENIAEIVNRSIINGSFLLNDSINVEFKSDGTINGIDTITEYRFIQDYYDAGMNFDKIYLKINNQENEKCFGYQKKEGYFEIFKLICEVVEPENPDFCLKYSKGELIYKFKIKN